MVVVHAGYLRIAVRFAVDELEDVGVLPVLHGHPCGPSGAAGDDARGDEVIDIHTVHGGDFAGEALVEDTRDLHEHQRQRTGPAGGAAGTAQYRAGGSDAAQVEHELYRSPVRP
jgi:hypothetical protein